jgi:methylaspartate ammonia-lyase
MCTTAMKQRQWNNGNETTATSRQSHQKNMVCDSRCHTTRSLSAHLLIHHPSHLLEMSSPDHASSFAVADIQEVVFYCESHIRAIFNAYELADDDVIRFKVGNLYYVYKPGYNLGLTECALGH